MVYTAIDNYRDRQATRRRGLSSLPFRLTASIGIWEAMAGAMCHAVFLVLGTFALFAPPPPPSRRLYGDLFSIGFIVIQATIVGVRTRNQIVRLQIRHYLEQQLRDA